MRRVTDLILLISAMCFLPSCVSQHRYLLLKIPKSWYEAQRYCRENYEDLATIDDMREMETVLKTAEGHYSEAWIGLSKGTTLTWHWSLADKDFYKEGERNYLKWGKEKVVYHCGLYTKGKMYASQCHKQQNAVCYDGKKQNEERYVLITKNLTWNEAQEYCRKHHTDLASVRNENESQMIQELTEGKVWVGLFRDAWKWSDQTYSSLRYWKTDQQVYSDPKIESCAALFNSESGRWGERLCEEKHYFLCHTGPTVKSSQVFKLRFSSWDSELNPDDPAVQNSILKKVEQELTKMGVTNVMLRWKKQPDGRVFFKEPHQGG